MTAIPRPVVAASLALVALSVACEPVFANHEGTPAGVSLAPDKDAVTIPESVRLIADADRHLYGTGYSVVVIDDDSGAQLGNTCGQTPCAYSGSTSWANNPDPKPRHFHAELRGPGGGTVARSGQVTVEVRKHVWNIESVVANPTIRVVPGSIQFVATLDHTTSGTPYDIYIYDEDNPTSPTNCNQYICARYITRHWADNVNPKPGRVRVVVRHRTNGDVASDTVYAEAPFRRFIFSPNLAFSSQTDTGGNVTHKATATLASTDPSVYGTPYRIKIRKADGTELCSAPQIGCSTTVGVGNTYRAVVEDSQGRNFGDSGAWTLTADGPRRDVIDDVDLAQLASLFASSTAICNALAEYPGSHLMEPPSTLSDQYRICVVSANAGKTKVDVLRDIATGIGGAAALGGLWYLRSQTQRPLPPPGTPTTPEDAEAPRPVPAPLLPQVEKVAGTLLQQNPTLTQARADAVANQCLFLVGRLGLNANRECSSLPIFASGDDVPQATNHDLEALAFHPPWVRLNYEFGQTKPGAGWQSCPDMQPSQQCDEYPFFATLQGGPAATPTPHLKAIDAVQNMSQGGKYSAFSLTCLQRETGRPFLGVPLPPSSGIPTLSLCN